MDRRRGTNPSQAGAETEERSQGRRAPAEADDERRLAAHLGAESREPRCSTTGLASASTGADAHPSHEPAAGHRAERRYTAQARVMDKKGTSPAGRIELVGVDQTPPAGAAGGAGSIRSEHRGADGSSRARSSAATRSATIANSPGCGTNHGSGLRSGAGHAGSIPMRQAGGQLSGADPV